jgi:predicted GTPase
MMGLWDRIEDTLFEIKESIYDFFDDDHDDDNDDYSSERRSQQRDGLINSFRSQMSDFDRYIMERNFKMCLNYRNIYDEDDLKSFLNKSPKNIFTFDNTWETKKNRMNVKKEQLEKTISILGNAKNTPESLKESFDEILKTENQATCKKLQKILEKYEDCEINVVNIGKLKAGKSSLFNVLTDKPEFFATGRTRKTVEVQSFSLNGIRFTDTPGTDCYENDSDQAFDASTGADILIYAVSAMRGTVDEQDRSVIEKVLGELPENGKDRFITVITRIDSLQDETEIRTVKENIRNQINKIAGFSVPVFTSSSIKWFERSSGESHPAEKFRTDVFKMTENIRKEMNERRNRDVSSKISDIIAAYEENLGKVKNEIKDFEEQKAEIEKDIAEKLKTILRDARADFNRIENI